jgi:bacillithiol system protein YtxJ
VLDARTDITFAIIHVGQARAASNRVVELTGVKHESPQLVLLKDGRVVFTSHNWALTQAAVEGALAAHFPPPDVVR